MLEEEKEKELHAFFVDGAQLLQISQEAVLDSGTAGSYGISEAAEKSFNASLEKKFSDHRWGPPKQVKTRFNPKALKETAEGSTTISTCVEAKAVNIGMRPWVLEEKIKITEKDGRYFDQYGKERDESEVILLNKKYDQLESFFKNCGLRRYTFSKLRADRVRWLNKIGNCYWEVIRTNSGALAGFKPFKDQTSILPCEEDKEAYLHDFKIIEGTAIVKRKMYFYFRRYVQKTAMGMSRTYFKEFGDPRHLDRVTGKYYEPGADLPADFKKANEVVHFMMPGNGDLGDPPFCSAFVDAQTTRGAKLSNRQTMDNNGSPKMAAVVTNVKDDQIGREIERKFKHIQQSGSKHAIMVLVMKPQIAGPPQDAKPVNPKLEFLPLGNLQESEGMFLKLIDATQKDTQSTFRIPDILLGKGNDYNRATSYEAKITAENQVFSPERLEFDEWVNEILMPELGQSYHTFKTLGNNLMDVDLIKALFKVYADRGGLTPDDLARISQEFIGVDIEPKDEPWSKVPYYFANKIAQQAETQEPGTAQEMDMPKDLAKQVLAEVLGPMVEGMDLKGAWVYEPKTCAH